LEILAGYLSVSEESQFYAESLPMQASSVEQQVYGTNGQLILENNACTQSVMQVSNTQVLALLDLVCSRWLDQLMMGSWIQ